jgi:hypothetical protein
MANITGLPERKMAFLLYGDPLLLDGANKDSSGLIKRPGRVIIRVVK